MIMKILLVVIDGAADRPHEDLDYKTPLELAEKPFLDQLAKIGVQGLMIPIERGIAPESDSAVLSLMGYDPSEIRAPRGLIEALGAGIKFKNGWLALRANFATIKDRKIIDRRVGRSLTTKEAIKLAEAITKNVKLTGADFQFKATVGHRAVLVIKDYTTPLSDEISNVDPAYVKMGSIGVALSKPQMEIPECKPLVDDPQAIRAANLVNEFIWKSYEILKDHKVNIMRLKKGLLPANFILVRNAASKKPQVLSFKERFGLKGVVIAEMPVEIGIAKLLGLNTKLVPIGRSLEDFKRRAITALKALERYQFVYIHLKGPDEPGHDGDYKGKISAIELIDKGFFSTIVRRIDLDKTIIVITSDHATPWSMHSHSDDPVPLLITGDKIEGDDTKKFCEKEAERGKLKMINHGYELMDLIIRLVKEK